MEPISDGPIHWGTGSALESRVAKTPLGNNPNTYVGALISRVGVPLKRILNGFYKVTLKV